MKNQLRRSVALFGVLAIVVLAISQVAWAQGLDTDTPDLPPDGVYLTADDVHAKYTGADLEIVLEDPIHKPIADEVGRRIIAGTDIEEEIFQSVLTGNVVGLGPVTLTGQVTTWVRGKATSATGSFDTEIVSMDLSGIVGGMPVQIREDPDSQSLGETTITDLGGGEWHVDSFFDVFTELRVEMFGKWGPWMPDTVAPVRMTLVPEPGSLGLLGIGVIGLLGYVWRRKRAV